MAFVAGKESGVYVNQYDLTGYFKGIKIKASGETAETTTFGNTAKNYIPTLTDSTLSGDLLFDRAGQDAFISPLLGADGTLFSIIIDTEAIGVRTYSISCVQTSYSVDASVGDVVSGSIEAQSKVGLDNGVLLHVLGAETVTGNSTSVDNSASSSNGSAGYLHVTAASGTNTVKVQHSTNNSSWSDLITFTSFTGATSERITTSSTVNRYVRCSFTIGTSATFIVSFSRK